MPTLLRIFYLMLVTYLTIFSNFHFTFLWFGVVVTIGISLFLLKYWETDLEFNIKTAFESIILKQNHQVEFKEVILSFMIDIFIIASLDLVNIVALLVVARNIGNYWYFILGMFIYTLISTIIITFTEYEWLKEFYAKHFNKEE